MKSQIRTSDCEGWSYFLAGLCDGRPKKNRISMKQIGCFVSVIFGHPEKKRWCPVDRRCGQRPESFSDVLTLRITFFLRCQPSVLTFSCSQKCEWYLFIVYENDIIYCLVAWFRVVSQVWGKVRWVSFIFSLWMLTSLWLAAWDQILSPIGQKYQASRCTHQNKSLFFSPVLG